MLVKCPVCTKTFSPPVREINRGNGRFCSRACARSSRAGVRLKPDNARCSRCGKTFRRAPSKMRRVMFCSRECKDSAQGYGEDYDSRISPPHYTGSATSSDVAKRRLDMSQCSSCGYDSFPILHVHHRDRDRGNNDLSNLEVLCPNCHAERHYLERVLVDDQGIEPC